MAPFTMRSPGTTRPLRGAAADGRPTGRQLASVDAAVPAQEPLVLVVDDDAAIRFMVCELLRSVDIKAAGFGSPRELIQADVLDRPGCMILDVRMPEVSGLDLQSQLAESGIPASIIFLTGHGDIPMAVQAMKAGAVEFLTKPVRDQTLLDAVNRAIALDRTRRNDVLVARRNAALYASLTPRERQVMRGIVRGALNKQIAFELGITEITVKLHRSGVMRKMQARTVAQLVTTWQTLAEDLREEPRIHSVA